MISDPASRWVIIGNSGSGKSTLAEHVGMALHLPVHDLDLIHWHQDGRKRDEAEAKASVADIAWTGAWVIEGVYGWLTEVALPQADALIWLDLPWDECRNSLLARGLRRGMTPNDQDTLLFGRRATGPEQPLLHSRDMKFSTGSSWDPKHIFERGRRSLPMCCGLQASAESSDLIILSQLALGMPKANRYRAHPFARSSFLRIKT